MKKIIALMAVTLFGISFNLYAQKGNMDHPMDKHHPRFEALDTDKDGKISKEEWMAHFNEMDENKDGSISEDEMKKHHEKMQEKMHEHMHDQMHKKIDDKKGK